VGNCGISAWVSSGKCGGSDGEWGWGLGNQLGTGGNRVEEGVGGAGRQFGTVSPHSTSTPVERPS
jgi:hypothetical protein